MAGSHGCCVSQLNLASFGRLSLRFAAVHPLPDWIISAVPRHIEARRYNRQKLQKKRFKSYPIGYSHMDLPDLQPEEGRLERFVAIDRTSKYAYVELHERGIRMEAKDFPVSLIAAIPYAIHTVLTDNGIQFAKREGTEAYWHIPFDRVCKAHGIEHRLTQVCHPWTNDQVERMNRTIKEATFKRYYCQPHDQLMAHP